jgi:acyl dehydratase
MARTVNGIDEVRALAGQDLGYSRWHDVTQEAVNLFADATGDHQWIHTDRERAKDGPFGRTIAHGYFTLSLAPMLLADIVRVEGTSMGINYGINKLRFPAPMPVGEKVRLGVKVANVEDVSGGVQLTYAMTFEVEGQERPACVAEVVYRVVA